jgi:AraC-like DNA-binding protein
MKMNTRVEPDFREVRFQDFSELSATAMLQIADHLQKLRGFQHPIDGEQKPLGSGQPQGMTGSAGLQTPVAQPSTPAFEAPANECFDTIRRLLDSQTDPRPLPIGRAAKLAGLSARTLQRRLAKQGLTYRRLVNALRFKAAAVRLRDPLISVTDIALDLGYSDTAHFSRAFRRIAGMSPRQYRRRLLDPRRGGVRS